MSANNWTVCPNCLAEHDRTSARNLAKAKALYGKVSLAEYEKAMASAGRDGKKLIDRDSLREDYEIGVDAKGMFEINYGCSCEKCGFTYTFKHEEKAIPQ